MQTVNFNCPHCGNLMAVGTNLLGRNVRCPHCKQVVRAPAAPGEAPSVQLPAPMAPPLTPGPPPFKVSTTVEHHESIFGERHDEDVFGSVPLKPTLPPAPAPAPASVAPPPPPAPLQETAFAPPPPEAVETQPYDFPLAPPPPIAPAAVEPEPRTPYRPREAKAEAPATPAFAWILLAYSALISVVAGVLAFQYFTTDTKGDHPFKAIPDFFGQYEKANRKQLSFNGLPDPKTDVPAELRVKLNEEITVGELQVKPTAVQSQVLSLTRELKDRENVTSRAGNGLVLTLHVKNLSADTTFHPDDPAFNRAFESSQPFPYTALQQGREFYYGPFVWPFEAEIKNAFVEDFKNPEEPLGPGQERDIWITTAPDGARTAGERKAGGDLKRLLEDKKFDTPFLWRVQLRRGLVKAQADGREVEVSATTVIGVEFRADQVKER
jgi:hypothetical protein